MKSEFLDAIEQGKSESSAGPAAPAAERAPAPEPQRAERSERAPAPAAERPSRPPRAAERPAVRAEAAPRQERPPRREGERTELERAVEDLAVARGLGRSPGKTAPVYDVGEHATFIDKDHKKTTAWGAFIGGFAGVVTSLATLIMSPGATAYYASLFGAAGLLTPISAVVGAIAGGIFFNKYYRVSMYPKKLRERNSRK